MGEKTAGRPSEADTARDPSGLTSDPKWPHTAPSDRSGDNQTGGSSRSNWGGSGWDNISRRQDSSGGDNGGGRSSTGSARAVMEPAPKKAKVQNEEDTFREMLVKATDRYRGNPSGIAAMTERAIVAMGVQPDRSEVLAVTAKILAYHYHKQGK